MSYGVYIFLPHATWPPIRKTCPKIQCSNAPEKGVLFLDARPCNANKVLKKTSVNFLTTESFHFPTLDRHACNSYVKVSWRLGPLLKVGANSLTGEGLPLYHLQWFADGRDHRWRMDIPR